MSKDKNGVQKREPLTTEWHDWIDYWSVDFDYDSKKEIIRLQAEDATAEEKWTGNYIFEMSGRASAPSRTGRWSLPQHPACMESLASTASW